MKLDLKGWVIPTGIGVASFAVGTAVGYFVKLKTIDKKIHDEVVEVKEELKDELQTDNVQLHFQFEDFKQHMTYSLQQTALIINRWNEDVRTHLDRNVDPELHISIDRHPANAKHEVVINHISSQEEEDEPMVNVFVNEDDDGWNYAVEVPLRTPDKPYIIHRDEYFSDEMDLSQSSLTFYMGDEILCDEQNVPVYNPDKIVGLIRFGHGSKDPSICYIRNEELEAEYEILMDYGYYQTEVLGEAIENNSLKHSKRLLKFRPE